MITAIVTIIIFLVMISLHEFGHFIMSKLCGVKVLEFAIGMGPAIFKHKGKETLYSVRIFPVGGYCKLEGEDEKTDDERAFCNQKWWKRFLVIVAGAVLNIVLGFVILFIVTANTPSGYIATPVIESIDSDSFLAETGVMPGDKIIKINGEKVHFYPDISMITEKISGEEDVELVLKRNGKKITINVKPSREISTYYYGEENVTIKTKINNGEETTVIAQYPGEEAKEQYSGKTETTERYILGFMPKTEQVGFFNNCVYSYHYTGFVVKMVYNGLWDMVTGRTGLEQVSGPVGIVDAVNESVKSGEYWVLNVLNLTALLTINLGVFNLLPLPALDGGRLFFMIIELIRRKPVPAEREGLVHAIGLILLLGFAVVISFKDIIMLFR